MCLAENSWGKLHMMVRWSYGWALGQFRDRSQALWRPRVVTEYNMRLVSAVREWEKSGVYGVVLSISLWLVRSNYYLDGGPGKFHNRLSGTLNSSDVGLNPLFFYENVVYRRISQHEFWTMSSWPTWLRINDNYGEITILVPSTSCAVLFWSILLRTVQAFT